MSEEEVRTQVSQIQCSKRSKNISVDVMNISDTYDAEKDTNTILTKTQVHVPNGMNIADDSPFRESYASKRNENDAVVASGLIPIKWEAKGNRQSVSDVTTASHVDEAVAISNISTRNEIMSSFDEINVDNPSRVLFYRAVKPTKLAAECKGKKIKQEKKSKAKVIAEFEDTTFILFDNTDAASELIDNDNH